jgi:hypothetical protein
MSPKLKLCECGCGMPAPMALTSRRSLGQKKGEPLRFICGHNRRIPLESWEDRFDKKTVRLPNGCLQWTDHLSKRTGYGLFSLLIDGRNIQRLPHRVAYERWKGPIPPGMDVDHLCRNRGCVEPDHLEAVTHLENVRRGNAPSTIASREGLCKFGHPLTQAKTQKRCLQCRREYQRKRRELNQKKVA